MLSIIWDFDPTIFSIGGLEIRYYSVMWILGFVQGMIVLQYILKREGEPEKYNDSLFWYITISTIVGARLGHCLIYEPATYLADPISILNLREGGFASHGGTIGIAIGLYLFCRKYHKGYIWMLDRAALLAPLAACFIRIGNFFNSEIYGIETTSPFGVIFVREGETVAKHPTQLYEAAVYFVLFFVLMYLYRYKDVAKKFPGMLIGIMFTCIFLGRFFIENIKQVQVEFEKNMTYNMGQWLSVPFVIIGILLIIYSLKKKKIVIGNDKPKYKK